MKSKTEITLDAILELNNVLLNIECQEFVPSIYDENGKHIEGGLRELVFGKNYLEVEESPSMALGRKNISESEIIKKIHFIYDYGEKGLLPKDFKYEDDISSPIEETEDVVRILSAADTVQQNQEFLRELYELLKKADTRYGMDFLELDLSIENVASLAMIDERTVKNAISSGELETYKEEAGVGKKKITYIKRDSAIRWLLKRKKFIPTQFPTESEMKLKDVKSIVDFKRFIKQRAEEIETYNPQIIAELTSISTMVEQSPIVELSSAYRLSEALRLKENEVAIKICEIYFPEVYALFK